MRKSKSFANRLSRNITLVVSGIIVVMLLVLAVTSHMLIAEEATRAAQYMLHGTISEMEVPLNTVEVSTQVVATHAASLDGNVRALEMLTQATVDRSKLITGCAVIYADRDVPVIYSLRDADRNMQTVQLPDSIAQLCRQAWLTPVAETGKPRWTDPQVYFPGMPRIVTYCYPLYAADSSVYAVVTADLPIDWMERKVQSLRPYKNSFTIILCGNGLVGLPDSVDEADFKRLLSQYKDVSDLTGDMKQGKDSIRRFNINSSLSFVVYGPLHNGWSMAISCQYKDVLARSSLMHINLIVVGVIGLVLLFFICRKTVRRMTRPVTELSVSALNMAKGNFKAMLPEIKTEDEMLRLHDSFAYLQHSIEEYIRELKMTTRANERMESELNVAREIQKGMLRTDFPDTLHAVLSPAKEVGGDLYDFYFADDHRLYFAIGDVSGKGVPAALMMAITRASLRLVVEMDLPLASIVERVNCCVTDTNSDNMFVTLFVGCVDLQTGEMDYCNAGHNPIVIVPPVGDPYMLKAKPNLAIGVFGDFVYQGEHTVLQPGSRIVAYTDGVTEAERSDKQQFGEERLLQWAAQEKVRLSDDRMVADDLFDTVKAFADGNPQNDDITIVCLHVPAHSDSQQQCNTDSMTKKRFNPISDKSAEIIEYVMSSPDIPDDEMLRFKIRLSVEEAVENVVRYAYEGGIGWLEIGTRLDQDNLLLTIELRDAGVPFNPLDKPDPDITLSAEERNIGGLGIFLSKKMMDSISYRYENGNNILTMSKSVG